MQAASRAYALAAAALAATSAVIVTSTAPGPLQLPIRSIETRLVDSVANIPVNLFDAIMNIPSNEVQGVDVFSNSLFFSGDWWVPSAVNIWGTDPGDPGHYMGLLDMMIPFPQISGLGQPEIDPTLDANGTAGLAQQLALLAAAELPTSASCDAETCFPMTPPNVITGSTQFDRDIGFLQALSGQATDAHGQPFSLFSDWIKVPWSDLTNGFTFNSSTDPGIVDPSPGTGPGGVVTGAFGFPGTTGPDGTGVGNYMPWAGDTFKLNLLGPFGAFYNSLLATPSTSGIGGTGIEIPTMTEVTQAFQNLAASSIVAFDPYVMGSPMCPATCDIPAAETQQALVADVLAWDPSNTTIQEWLDNYPDSNATTLQSELAVALLQTGMYNLTPTELATYDADLASINPELPYLYTNAGIVTDPNYVAFANDPSVGFDPVYGGYNPNLVAGDLLTLMTNNETNWSALSNINTLWFLADPVPAAAAATDQSSSAATDLSAALGGFDPATWSADLSQMLAGLGTTTGSDLLSQLISELGAQLAADFGTQVPSSLLSMF
jgi:hypothetical protein